MRLRIPWRSVALVSTTALVTLIVHSALAGGSQPVSTTARGISRVQVVASQQGASTGGSFVNIDGATSTVQIPASWTSGLILARFTASDGGGDSTYVQILIDGAVAKSRVGCFCAGGMHTDTYDGWLALGPGSHMVQVQYQNDHATLYLERWNLTVELARAR
jgi:hypothetical protein